MNKKAQLFDLISLVIIILVALIVFGIIVFANNSLTTSIMGIETNEYIRTTVQTNSESKAAAIDFSLALFFFLVLLFLLYLNYILEISLISMIIYLVSIFVLPFLFFAGHKALNALFLALPMLQTSLPIMYFITIQFYKIMAFYYIFLFITLFLKPARSGE